MLTAAVSGSIFASPSVSQIFNAVKTIGGKAGTLLIVKNYTGDVLNFSLAAGKASSAGVPASFVVVADDVSVGREKSGKVGRRGLAGTVLVHKIVGSYAAQSGAGLDTVRGFAQSVADNLVTVGASLNRVHVPGRSADAADFLGQDELELGMGIHNEPGCRRITPLPSLSGLVEEMLKQLLDSKDEDRAYVNFGDAPEDVVLMVNNLGGTSVLELGGVATEILRQLGKKTLTLVCLIFRTLTPIPMRRFLLQNHPSSNLRRHLHDLSRRPRLQHHSPQSHLRNASTPRHRRWSRRLVTRQSLQHPRIRESRAKSRESDHAD